MRLLHEDEGIMAIICLAINVFFFLKVVGHRISDIKLFAACISSPLKNILIFSETFSDTLPWLSALFSNNIELGILNLITKSQKIFVLKI